MNRSTSRLRTILLMSPPLILLALFLILPILYLFSRGLYSTVISAEPLPPYFWSHLFHVTKNTLTLASLTTVISLVIALPLAFLLARTDMFASRLLLSLLTIPMITPPFIMAFSILTLYGRSGIVSLMLQRLGIVTTHIFGLPGLLIMQLTVSIPYAIFIMAAGLQGVPRHIDEMASSLGVYPLRYILEVVIPCIYPHIIISGLMIFLISIGDIGGPLVVGGGYAVLSSEIYTNFLSLLNDERIALMLSLWIIALSLLLLAGVTRLLKLTVKKYVPGINPVMYNLKGYRGVATLAVSCIVLLLLLPFVVTCIQSVVNIWSFEIIPKGWTGANYRSILQPTKVFFDTFLMAVLATLIITVMSLILGHMMFHKKTLRIFNFVLIIPLVLPGIVLAVGVLRTYALLFPSDHTIPFFMLLLFTIVIRRLPYSLKTLEAGFISSDPQKEEIAISLGSSQFMAFFRITLPQIKTYLYAAIFIGIIKTATELSASLILSPLNWNSISLQIMNLIDQGALSKASALSVVLVAIIGLGTFLVAFWSQGRANAQHPYSAEALERLVLGRTPMSYYHKGKKHKSRWAIPLLKKKEPLLVVADRFGIIEANESFLRMVGSDTLGQLQKESSFSMLFFGDKEVLEIFSSLGRIENRATSIMILNGSRVPILLNAYVATSADNTKTARFYCKKVTGHSRRIRDYTLLRERMAVAEQTALKAQITPHFLFNSLNSVIQLIDSSPSEARDVVQNMADLYRYILYSTKQNLVTIEQEMDSIYTYLAIEKARFGDKLHFEITLEPSAKDVMIPPMILQPIVENAVSHGVKDNGEIEVKVSVDSFRDNIVMRVEDHGDREFDHAKIATGKGTGLKNVEGRLFSLYHRRIAYTKREGGGLIVTIAIPRERS